MFVKILKTLLGILLIPIAIGTAKAFYSEVSDISLLSGLLHVLERGVLAYLIIHIFILRPVYIYVLGHEFVHVIATWLCGGQVISFNVSPRGGNVVTSKTNFFIELSPYFVPIYTILIGIIYFFLRSIDKEIPHMSLVFIFLVGFTLAFHFVMTSEVLRMEQPDIMKSGIVFSFVVIFVANLFVVTLAFSPIFSDISFLSFVKQAWNGSIEAYQYCFDKVIVFVSAHNFA